jgi:hypothetical protein
MVQTLNNENLKSDNLS